MSLRVWLPLNGTLDNQGLDNVVVTNNGATIDNNGKIGKCYTFDGNSSGININGNIISTLAQGDFSICFWIYNDDQGNRSIYIATVPSSGYAFAIQKTTGEGLRVYWQSSPDYYPANFIVPVQQWCHITVVIKNNNCYCYRNGILITSKEDGSFTPQKLTNTWLYGMLGRDLRTGATVLKGKMNDFRWYDHALSPLEVKQISQGLILHYPLNNNGWGQENLLINSGFFKTSQGWTNNQSTVVSSENNELKVVINQTTSSPGIKATTSFSLNAGTYTASLLIKVENGKKDYISFPFYMNNGSGVIYNGAYIKKEKRGEYMYEEATFTLSSAVENIIFYVLSSGTLNGETWYIKNIKLEKGQIATPWCPNEVDELYNQLEINNDIQYDTSGYKNNGVKTGTFTYDSNTPKYNVSMVFNKASYINIGQQLFNARDEITVNLWVKASSWTTNPGTFFSSMESGGNGWQKSGNNYIVSCGTGASSNSYATTSITTTSLDASEWHMMTFTYDGMVLKTYIDAILQTTVSKYSTKTPLFYNSKSTMFIGGEATTNKNTPANSSTYPNFKGKISDVRIYCTALSAEDILSLYNNSAYIDNQGNIYGAIYEEV